MRLIALGAITLIIGNISAYFLGRLFDDTFFQLVMAIGIGIISGYLIAKGITEEY